MSERHRFFVGIGEGVIFETPSVAVISGLGSCVVVYLYDILSRAGGVVHAVYPSLNSGAKMLKFGRSIYRYAYEGIMEMVRQLRLKGCQVFRAKIVGGASLFDSSFYTRFFNVSIKNVQKATEALAELNIDIVSSDTGGKFSRNVFIYFPEHRIKVLYSDGREKWL